MIEAVSEHFFVTLRLDYNKVIKKFLQIKKDEKQDDSHYLRYAYFSDLLENLRGIRKSLTETKQ